MHTTDSKHTVPVSPNVLARQFEKQQPNQAWVSDITYIRTRSGWLYLAAVLELHSRKIVGWAWHPRCLQRWSARPCIWLSCSAIPLPVWWCIRTGEPSTQAPSIKDC